MVVKVHTSPQTQPASIDDTAVLGPDTPSLPSVTDREIQEGESIVDHTNQAMESILNDPEMEMLYRDAKMVRDKINLSQINERNATRMENHISEYLQSFVILGYDLLGQRILIQHTPKQADVDSLQKYLEHVSSGGVLYANMIARQQNAAKNEDDDEDDD